MGRSEPHPRCAGIQSRGGWVDSCEERNAKVRGFHHSVFLDVIGRGVTGPGLAAAGGVESDRQGGAGKS